MDSAVFRQLTGLIYEKSGITLSSNKDALVSARIAKRMRHLGMQEYEAYLDYLLNDDSGEEVVHLLDVISTNVTHFFREEEHFTMARDKMVEWMGARRDRFTFWSAACSSGEEPYSLAMVLCDVTAGARVELRILATDISTKILEKSRQGIYDAKKMETVPPRYRDSYFTKTGRGEHSQYSASESLRSIISFNRLNLSDVPYPMKGPMDIVFCRNVMIYFDSRVRQQLLEEIYRLLRPGGLLFIGHAESLAGLSTRFALVKPSVYCKKE